MYGDETSNNNDKSAEVRYAGAHGIILTTAWAYYHMPQIANHVTRLVAAGVTGVGAIAGVSLGCLAGGLAAYFGAMAIRSLEDFSGLAMIGGAFAGAVTGLFTGYHGTKAFMIEQSHKFDAQLTEQSEQVEESAFYQKGDDFTITDRTTGAPVHLTLAY